jgi:hypothetical protein
MRTFEKGSSKYIRYTIVISRRFLSSSLRSISQFRALKVIISFGIVRHSIGSQAT